MIKKAVVFGGLVLLALSFNACYYDKEELVYPKSTCDTVAVSYKTNIASIISANCYSCHSGTAENGAGIQLDSYDNLKNMAIFGPLLQVVRHDAGFAQMPKGGSKLSDCNIAKIRIWVEAGAPDN